MKLRRKQKIQSRRARPIIGRSLSSNSYYRPKNTALSSVETSQKKQTEETKKSRFKLPSIGKLVNFAIVVLFSVLIFFATTLSSTPDVKIAESNFQFRSTSEYQERASSLLNENVLRKSKILFRSQDFEASMIERFPEISAIDAIVPLGGRNLTVSMSLSEPLAVVSNGSEKGIVDENGFLVSKDTENQKNLYTIRFTTPQDTFDVGSRIFTTEEVNQLQLLSKELSDIELDYKGKKLTGLNVTEVLFNVRDGQFEVKLAEVPYIIKLSAYADSEEQVGATKVTLLELHNELKKPPVKYLDARVPGRVFVL